MEQSEVKNQMIKAIMDVEYYPVIKEDTSLEKYAKLPLSKISAMGVAFEPLTAAIQSVFGGGAKSGLYRVNVTGGGHLAKLKNESSFIGTVLNENNVISGQARLNPLILDPATLFMATALASIDQKLDTIQETQQEILEFLEHQEKSKLKGNLNFLSDVLNNYKYNWNNDKYKNSNHIKVLDIKQDAEQSIIFHRLQIDKKIEKKSFFYGDQEVKNKLKKIQSEFIDYHLALYLYSFSSFLEVMLLENFDSKYLNVVSQKIEKYSFQYRELYSKTYEQIEKYSKSSINSHLIKGLASISKVAGDAVAKVPIVSNSQIDESLMKVSSRLERFNSNNTEQTMEMFLKHQNSSVRTFIESINSVNTLYNHPLEIYLDQENIYYSEIVN